MEDGFLRYASTKMRLASGSPGAPVTERAAQHWAVADSVPSRQSPAVRNPMSQLRKMQQKDIKEVGDLWKYVYKTEHPSLSDEELDSDYIKMINKCLPYAVAASMGYVYEIGDNVVGFITLDPSRTSRNRSYIDNPYVNLGHRRRRVATKLVEQAQKLYDYLYLHVFETAAPTINLYGKCGITRVRQKVRKKKDKIRMEWYRD